MQTLSAVLIVKNEESKLESCLQALTWVDEIIVIDSLSTDRTLEIAKQYTAKVFQRPFDNFANQKNYGIEQATGDWILSIDADEKVSVELQKSIQKVIGEDGSLDGYRVVRKNIIFGKSLKFAGQGSERLLRLFRRGKGRLEQPIHEEVVLEGPIGEIDGELIHDSIRTLEDYFRKLHLYTDYEAQFMHDKGIAPTFYGLYIKPVFRFVYHYIIRLGFLDGYPGFLYHGLSSYYVFRKYVKLRELQSVKG